LFGPTGDTATNVSQYLELKFRRLALSWLMPTREAFKHQQFKLTNIFSKHMWLMPLIRKIKHFKFQSDFLNYPAKLKFKPVFQKRIDMLFYIQHLHQHTYISFSYVNSQS